MKFIDKRQVMSKPLVSLEFEIEFTTTGKVYKGSHTFETGLSAITGKNEAGKSLRLEMIRYALFGSDALRASSDNYKKIDVTLEFHVGEELYSVNRKKTKALLKKGDKELATGTTPVNKAIVDILGYDLEVFDIANACLQGQIEAMTDKTPTERKRMVDRTIGLDTIDLVVKKANDDITATRKAIELLEDKVIQKYEYPVNPGLPEDENIENQEALLYQLDEKSKRLSYINGQLDSHKCENPNDTTIIIDATPEFTLEDLQTQLQQIKLDYAVVGEKKLILKNYKTAKDAIEGFDIAKVEMFVSNKMDEDWRKYELYEILRVEKPNYTLADIEIIKFTQECIRFNKEESECEDAECPSCAHKFKLLNGKTFVKREYNEEEYEQAKLRTGGNTNIHSLEAGLEAYDKFMNKVPVEKPLLGKEYNKPNLLPHLETLRSFIGLDIEAVEKDVQEAEENYKQKDVVERKISQKQKHLESKVAYDKAKEKYEKYNQLKGQFAEELLTLQGVGDKIDVVKNKIMLLKTYEQAIKIYEARQQSQAEAVQTKAELEVNLETLNRVKKALNELKPKVKTYLLPSLNRVASHLISEMTNAQRNKIVVDENFDIEVDGQPVETLSGSGKAVANLAVRIGLGMVLTNKKFSVFLADEIDAAMDSERALYTAQCLRNLTNTIGQIILVSHKQPDADHNIIL